MSPSSFAAAQWAAVAPTLPAPTIVIFGLGLRVNVFPPQFTVFQKHRTTFPIFSVALCSDSDNIARGAYCATGASTCYRPASHAKMKGAPTMRDAATADTAVVGAGGRSRVVTGSTMVIDKGLGPERSRVTYCDWPRIMSISSSSGSAPSLLYPSRHTYPQSAAAIVGADTPCIRVGRLLEVAVYQSKWRLISTGVVPSSLHTSKCPTAPSTCRLRGGRELISACTGYGFRRSQRSG